jgi:uncharacterized protein (TIGR03000 family)
MRYLTSLALSIACFIPTIAFAQGGHGGGGGSHGSGGGGSSHSGGGGGWSHGGGGSWGGGGGWNGGRYWGGGYYPYTAFGWGGYGLPGYSYYGYPRYYDYPGYVYRDFSPRISSYYDPIADSPFSISAVPSNRAQLEILVPDPNTELLIQNQRMTLMGNRRVFVSPDLDPGKTYTYTITARRNISGRTEDETRQIDVRAGSSTKLDFSIPQNNSSPAPRPSGE